MNWISNEALAEVILKALRQSDESNWVDAGEKYGDSNLDSVCLDGHFNLIKIADLINRELNIDELD